MDDANSTSRSLDSRVFSSTTNNPNSLPTLQTQQTIQHEIAGRSSHTVKRNMPAYCHEKNCQRCKICKDCDSCKDNDNCVYCNCQNCHSGNPRNDNKCLPMCGLTCPICGNRRCLCSNCTSLRGNRGIGPFIGEYNPKKLPPLGLGSDDHRKRGGGLTRKWRKILARPRRCRCHQKPEPVCFIDLLEKERLTFIEYAGFRRENLVTKARRRSLSPDDKTRVIDFILKTLNPPRSPPPPPPSCPTTKGPTDRKPEDPDQGGAGFALAVPTLPKTFQITSCRAFIPPSPKEQRFQSPRPQSPSNPNRALELALQRSHAAVRHLLTPLTTTYSNNNNNNNNNNPTRNPTLTLISLRHQLRALFAQLATVIHRTYPQLSPLIHPNHAVFQHELSDARQRVQLAWKGLWRVALGGGLMVLGRRRVGGLEIGGRRGAELEDAVLVEVSGAVIVLADELRGVILVVRVGRCLV